MKMQTKKVVVLFTFFIAAFGFSQVATDTRDQLKFGIKAGVNYSNVYDEEGQNFVANGKAGFAAGGFIAIPIGKFLGVQPEIMYSQKGFKATGSVLGSAYEFKRNTNYLDVPLLIALKPNSMLTILAGPQLSFLLNEKYDFKNNVLSGEMQNKFDNEDLRKNTLCLTGGLDINMANLVISGRAGWDLKENNKDGTSTTPRYKNVWLQATIGFRF